MNNKLIQFKSIIKIYNNAKKAKINRKKLFYKIN